MGLAIGRGYEQRGCRRNDGAALLHHGPCLRYHSTIVKKRGRERGEKQTKVGLRKEIAVLYATILRGKSTRLKSAREGGAILESSDVQNRGSTLKFKRKEVEGLLPRRAKIVSVFWETPQRAQRERDGGGFPQKRRATWPCKIVGGGPTESN